MRDISREGGFTTGVLTHYFPDKQAVIVGAFLAASDDWFAELHRRLAGAGAPEEQLVALVHLALPADAERRAEWRLWAEMWTYAGRDPAFAAQLVETDAAWEREIRGVLERAREAGLLANVDAAAEAAVLARLIDGLGLRAWLGGTLGGRPRAARPPHGHARRPRPGAAADARGGRRVSAAPRTIIAGGTLATADGTVTADLVIEDGRVAAIADPGSGGDADELIDASGLVVMPGAIDMHAHFEDPGHTEREDFTTGTMSAAAGGFTDRDGAPAHLPARHDRRALSPEARDGPREGGRRLRPLGRAHRAVAPRDRRAVAGGRARLQGLHADLGPVVPQRVRRRVPRGDAAREGGRRPGARPRRERLAAPGRARAHGGRRPPRPARPPRVAAAVRRGGGRAPRALPRRACRRADPDRARVEPGQRRSRAAARRPRAGPRRWRSARTTCCSTSTISSGSARTACCAPALRDRALVERLWDSVLDGTADCLVSDHSRLHARGEGARLGGHLRRARSAAR